MLITTVCPGCLTRYQVADALLGKVIRCPSKDCGITFAVGMAPPPPPAPAESRGGPGRKPPGSSQWSGSIDDFLTMLPAEPAGPTNGGTGNGSGHVSDFLPVEEAEPPPRGKPVEASWDQPPPVRNPLARAANPPPPPAPETLTRKSRPKSGPRTPTPTPVPAAKQTQIPAQGTKPTRVEPPPVLEEEPSADPPAPPELPTLDGGPDGPPSLVEGTWQAEAPPVRRGPDGEEVAPADGSQAAPSAEEAVAALAKRRRRRNLTVMVALGVLLVVSTAVGAVVFVRMTRESEGQLAEKAYKLFGDRRYGNASQDFRDLHTKFANTSQRLDEYHSMEDLSTALDFLTSGGNDPGAQLDRIGDFLGKHKADPIVKAHAKEVARETGELVDHGILDAEKANPSDATPAKLTQVKAVLDKVTLLDPGAFSPGDVERRSKDISEVEGVHRKWARRREERDRILAVLTTGEQKPAEALKLARGLVRRTEHDQELAGIGQDPAIVKAFDDLYQKHQASVVWVPNDGSGPDKPAPADITFPGILFDPRTEGVGGGRPPGDTVVLSLVRGVLYAHSRATGDVLWAVRVGVDTTNLPVRVPATSSSPERILVLRADTETLSAFDPEGNEVWRYRLGSPCLGRPVVYRTSDRSVQSVLLPTYDGRVHEVEVVAGRPLGHWQLGQPLSAGGAREGNSGVIYFPADDSCVYALNVDPKDRRCQTILYSNHPAGSLRGEPLVVPPINRVINNNVVTLPGFLILSQADGLNFSQLRVFPLPPTDREGPPFDLKPQPRMRGWPWFTPFLDGEKVAAATDYGVLGLFGVRQAGNQDEALFPMLASLNLDEVLKPDGAARGRAQVVYAQGDDFWVLSGGKLRLVSKVWNAAVGPKLVPGWKEPLELGSPLHASQVEEDRATDQKTLVVVTQALKQPTCLATAVRSDDGQKLWQRRLGLVCQGAPVTLGGPAAAGPAAVSSPPPVVLAMGQGGELFALDPGQYRGRTQWMSGAKSVLAGPLDDNPSAEPLLLPGPDGLSAYEVAFPGTGDRMVLRRVTLDPAARQTKCEQNEVKLPAGPAGLPVLVGTNLVLPMADGVLLRVPLAAPAEANTGADWRSRRIGSGARCYVAALGPDTFLATDGGKGLKCWRIEADGKMPGLISTADKPDDEAPALELDDRVVANPVVLPANGGATPVFVADAGGVLRALRLTATPALEETRVRWELGGRVTAGPFLRVLPGGQRRIGCVVDGRKLVWIEPKDGNATLWKYEAGAAIVGEPQLVEGRLLVADENGGLAALDPATGKPQGPGYALPGSVAPSAPPVAFDGESLFTPLTDGTVLLVPMRLFR